MRYVHKANSFTQIIQVLKDPFGIISNRVLQVVLENVNANLAEC